MNDSAPALLTSDLVGTTFQLARRSIDWRRTSSHAACVRDSNPRYWNNAAEEPLIAPPILATTLTWPALAQQPRDPFEPRMPDEPEVRGVHATD